MAAEMVRDVPLLLFSMDILSAGHLAFRVEDVEATVAELEQMGIGCEPIRLDSYTQKKMTFFFDPDGLPLELHE